MKPHGALIALGWMLTAATLTAWAVSPPADPWHDVRVPDVIALGELETIKESPTDVGGRFAKYGDPTGEFLAQGVLRVRRVLKGSLEGKPGHMNIPFLYIAAKERTSPRLPTFRTDGASFTAGQSGIWSLKMLDGQWWLSVTQHVGGFKPESALDTVLARLDEFKRLPDPQEIKPGQNDIGRTEPSPISVEGDVRKGYRHRGTLGFVWKPVGDRLVVGAVRPSSAAAEAGARPGDVVRDVEKTLVKSVDEFEEALSQYAGGQRVKVVIERGGALLVLWLPLPQGSVNAAMKDFSERVQNEVQRQEVQQVQQRAAREVEEKEAAKRRSR